MGEKGIIRGIIKEAIVVLAGQGKDEGQIAAELGVVLPVVITTLRKHYKE